MFIQCSDCQYKYLINSSDLKPNGRMVQCAHCSHSWYQELLQGEALLYSSVPKVEANEIIKKIHKEKKEDKDATIKPITNLPSTVVKEKKVSVTNSFLVIFFLANIF